MRRTYWYVMLVLGLCSNLNSQISLNNQHFPSVNDTLRYSYSNNMTIDYASTGEGYSWDFSSLTVNNQETIKAMPINNQNPLVILAFGMFAEANYKANYHYLAEEFPLNNVPQIPISEAREYHQLGLNKNTIVGYSLTVEGNDIPVKSSVIETVYNFPLNYGDNLLSNGKTQVDFNPYYNGEWRQERLRESEVDGWGNITTPFGSFDVLRIHNKIVETDSFYVSIVPNFPMWIPITLTHHEYIWKSNTDKGDILYVKTTEVFGNQAVNTVRYRDNYVSTLSKDEIENQFVIYPNPANDVIHISTEKQIDRIEIVSLDGKLLFSENQSVNFLNIERLDQGNYLLVVYSEGKVSRQMIRKM